MIVDTGASTTSINRLVLDRINPFKTDKYQLTRTGNGVIQMPLYNVNLEVKGLLSLPFLRVGMIECREDCVGVLGMDILEQCDMLMKHEDGELAMELRSPSDEIEFSLF